MTKKNKVNILGTDYKIEYVKSDKYIVEDGTICDGLCDFINKKIVIKDSENKGYMSSVFRHEIAHAYLYESGKMAEAYDEDMVSWCGAQIPKIYKTFKELGII